VRDDGDYICFLDLHANDDLFILSKLQVRIWNKYSSEMKDSIQPPQVMDRVAQRWR
jgi:hypothetical protein